MRTIHTILIAAACLSAKAMLPPTSHATLRQHMLEVNAQWATQSQDSPADSEDASYANEAERIRTHLLLVREQLGARHPEGFSAEQLAQRQHLLTRLGEYAEGRRFPQNYVLTYRNPVFIDPHGTACAVGWLMIESGHHLLADRISESMNLAYVLEMPESPLWPEIAEWATGHGFTAEELAWIQPGYAPPVLWVPVGGGTNGPVDAAFTMSNGDLVIAGQFTEAGGVPCNGAARWDGTSYTAMGSLPEGTVNCGIDNGGEPVLGGSFINGTVDLLRWNGSAWVPETVFASKSSVVTALHTAGGVLFAAGGLSGFAGTEYAVRAEIFGAWNPVGGSLNGPIHALEHMGIDLYAGGAFTGAFLNTQDDLMHVARLVDEAWQPVGNGLDGNVYDLLNYDDHVYATGDMASMIGYSFGLSRIATGETDWEPLMPNLQEYITVGPTDAPSVGYAMLEHEGRIFIAGMINYYEIMTMGEGLIVYNGSPDDVDAYCYFMGVGRALALRNGGELILAGASDSYHHVISTDISTGIEVPHAALELSASPNPSNASVRISAPDIVLNGADVIVLDADGRRVSPPLQRQTDALMIDASTLSAGAYTVRIHTDRELATARFVKE